jgi:hypothetical protein
VDRENTRNVDAKVSDATGTLFSATQTAMVTVTNAFGCGDPCDAAAVLFTP